MKRILACILFVSCYFYAYSQQPEPALARIQYNFLHIRDTLARDNPYQEQMLLVIGKNVSLFTSYDKISQLLRHAAAINEQVRANGGSLDGLTIKAIPRRPITYTDFYTYAQEKKVFIVETLMEKYIIEETAIPIDWKIAKDTVNLSGIHCQKATAYFKGRNWIAWFAPSLPFQIGPWRLSGLPGLILEAYDEKKEVQFLFSGFEPVTEANTVTKIEKVSLTKEGIPVGNDFYLGKEIKLPARAIKTTKEEVARLRQALFSNPQAMNSQMSTSGASIKQVSPPNANRSTAPKPVYNNPIELPEKK